MCDLENINHATYRRLSVPQAVSPPSSCADCEPSTDSVSIPILPPPKQIHTSFDGPRKSTLEDYLVSRHGFTSIHLESTNHYVRTHEFPTPLCFSSRSLFASIVVVGWLDLLLPAPQRPSDTGNFEYAPLHYPHTVGRTSL